MPPKLTRGLYLGTLGFIALAALGRALLGPSELSSYDAFLGLCLTAFCGILILIWKKAARHVAAELERVSATDPLTGLLCGNQVRHVLDAELDRSKRMKRPLALLLIDIDYFGVYNRKYGFTLGDEVLISFAADLTKNTRRYDSCFRFGHDEFILILPETNKPSARLIAERLRDAFANRFEGDLSLSMGLTLIDENQDSDPETLLRQLSSALAEARRQGGNRCRSYIERGL